MRSVSWVHVTRVASAVLSCGPHFSLDLRSVCPLRPKRPPPLCELPPNDQATAAAATDATCSRAWAHHKATPSRMLHENSCHCQKLSQPACMSAACTPSRPLGALLVLKCRGRACQLHKACKQRLTGRFSTSACDREGGRASVPTQRAQAAEGRPALAMICACVAEMLPNATLPLVVCMASPASLTLAIFMSPPALIRTTLAECVWRARPP